MISGSFLRERDAVLFRLRIALISGMALAFVIFIFALLLMQTRPAVAKSIEEMTTSDKCRALRQLDAQYRNAELSTVERAIKLQMVAWYRVNCLRRGARRTKG